jgi:hypothetical protein
MAALTERISVPKSWAMSLRTKTRRKEEEVEGVESPAEIARQDRAALLGRESAQLGPGVGKDVGEGHEQVPSAAPAACEYQ